MNVVCPQPRRNTDGLSPVSIQLTLPSNGLRVTGATPVWTGGSSCGVPVRHAGGSRPSAAPLANAGTPRQPGVDGAAAEPVIARAERPRRTRTAHPRAAGRRRARAIAANADGKATTGGVEAAPVAHVGAAAEAVAVAVPVAHQRGIGAHALAVRAAWIAGLGQAVLRRRVGPAVPGHRQAPARARLRSVGSGRRRAQRRRSRYAGAATNTAAIPLAAAGTPDLRSGLVDRAT